MTLPQSTRGVSVIYPNYNCWRLGKVSIWSRPQRFSPRNAACSPLALDSSRNPRERKRLALPPSLSLMARVSGPGEPSSRLPPPVKVRPSPDPLLIICRCFSFLTAIIAVLCVFVNVLSAVRSFKNGSDIFGGIFRCYAVALAIFVVVAETEWGFVMKFWRVLEYWAGRGMLQIFVAVMTRAFPDITEKRRDLVLLQEIASYFLLACGLTYVISGVLCIGFLKRARQHKKITRDQAAKDLDELERRRQELEALLIDFERA